MLFDPSLYKSHLKARACNGPKTNNTTYRPKGLEPQSVSREIPKGKEHGILTLSYLTNVKAKTKRRGRGSGTKRKKKEERRKKKEKGSEGQCRSQDSRLCYGESTHFLLVFHSRAALAVARSTFSNYKRLRTCNTSKISKTCGKGGTRCSEPHRTSLKCVCKP